MYNYTYYYNKTLFYKKNIDILELELCINAQFILTNLAKF